jgi:hypothetical protein
MKDLVDAIVPSLPPLPGFALRNDTNYFCVQSADRVVAPADGCQRYK